MSPKTWIDSPVEDLIDYFTSMVTGFTDVALKLAILVALVGIIYSAVQMAFGTMEVRKFVVGSITKYIFFLLCISLFPAFSKGLRTFSIQLSSVVSGKSLQDTSSRLGAYMQQIREDCLSEKQALQQQSDNIAAALAKAENYKSFQYQNLYEYGRNLEPNIRNMEKRKAEIDDKIALIGEDGTGLNKTYNAIRSVLIIDETDNSPLYTLNLAMYDSEGNDTGYLSPNALLRISLLASEIMIQKNWEVDAENLDFDSKDSESKATKKKKGFLVKYFSLNEIMSTIFCAITAVMIIVVSACTLIQYIMCIIEYAICSGFSIVLIPCMLFDGLKDMASKILPSLFAQAVKLSMITICMFFCADFYLDLAIEIIGTTTGFSLTTFAYVFFSIILSFALCSNAPKLAVTLLTGQPQLSMGEFVAAAGAIAGGAKMASSVAGAANEARKVGTAKAAQFTANRMGDVASMAGAAKTASTAAAMDGKSSGGQFKAGAAGALSALGSRTGKRIQSGLQNAATYSGKHGGGGSGGSAAGGGSGGSAAGGALKNRFESTKASKPDTDHSMSYSNSTRADGKVKSTLGEYLSSQYKSGSELGANQYGRSKENNALKNVSPGDLNDYKNSQTTAAQAYNADFNKNSHLANSSVRYTPDADGKINTPSQSLQSDIQSQKSMQASNDADKGRLVDWDWT